MSYITLKCKNCGANMSLNTESHSATCNHCGSTFLIGELLDEKDIAFTEKFTPQNIEQKMMTQEALKQGETYLFQAEFEKAEIAFKRAIELDETNYKGYLGVVKAKTQNLNVIPDDDDYVQYANYALNIAEGDELLIVKSELSKIKLLRREDARLKKTKLAKEKQEEKLRREKQGILKITSIICVFILLIFCVSIFVSSNLFAMIFKDKPAAKSIDVNSFETLEKVLTDDLYLNYDINLTTDIDCENKELTPFGTLSSPFTGTFNGNKHTISNAKIKTINDGTPYACVGIFGHTNLAKINNLVLDNVSISAIEQPSLNSIGYFGLLVGKAEATTINNIEIKKSCSIIINGNYEYNLSLGGLVGSALTATHIFSVSCHPNINLTSSQVFKSADSFVGSVVGLSNSSIIEKTCSDSTLYASLSTNSTLARPEAYVSGVIGYIQNATDKSLQNINNNFFSGLIDVYQAKNTNCKVGAIGCSNITSNTKLDNYCLFTSVNTSTLSTNFMLSGLNLMQVNLYDYSSSGNFVEFCYSYNSFMPKLSKAFLGWKNNNNYTPNLV